MPKHSPTSQDVPALPTSKPQQPPRRPHLPSRIMHRHSPPKQLRSPRFRLLSTQPRDSLFSTLDFRLLVMDLSFIDFSFIDFSFIDLSFIDHPLFELYTNRGGYPDENRQWWIYCLYIKSLPAFTLITTTVGNALQNHVMWPFLPFIVFMETSPSLQVRLDLPRNL